MNELVNNLKKENESLYNNIKQRKDAYEKLKFELEEKRKEIK